MGGTCEAGPVGRACVTGLVGGEKMRLTDFVFHERSVDSGDVASSFAPLEAFRFKIDRLFFLGVTLSSFAASTPALLAAFLSALATDFSASPFPVLVSFCTRSCAVGMGGGEGEGEEAGSALMKSS